VNLTSNRTHVPNVVTLLSSLSRPVTYWNLEYTAGLFVTSHVRDWCVGASNSCTLAHTNIHVQFPQIVHPHQKPSVETQLKLVTKQILSFLKTSIFTPVWLEKAHLPVQD